jgi:hypothetical protein
MYKWYSKDKRKNKNVPKGAIVMGSIADVDGFYLETHYIIDGEIYCIRDTKDAIPHKVDRCFVDVRKWGKYLTREA